MRPGKPVIDKIMPKRRVCFTHLIRSSPTDIEFSRPMCGFLINSIALHFAEWGVKEFSKHQLFSSDKALFKEVTVLSTVSPMQWKVVSSAYIKTEPEVTALGRSLVYKANNVGPSTSTLIVVYFSLFQHKLVVSCIFLSIRIVLSRFYLLIFYFEKFSTWIWRLPFAVYVMLKLSFVPVHKNAKTGTNFPSIQPATFIGPLIRPDASFFFLMPCNSQGRI